MRTYTLHYPGDVTEHMHPGQEHNAYGQRLIQNPPYGYPLRVQSSEYDATADRTTVTLEVATPSSSYLPVGAA